MVVNYIIKLIGIYFAFFIPSVVAIFFVLRIKNKTIKSNMERLLLSVKALGLPCLAVLIPPLLKSLTLFIAGVLNIGFIDKSNVSLVILGPFLILCGVIVWFNRKKWFDK